MSSSGKSLIIGLLFTVTMLAGCVNDAEDSESALSKIPREDRILGIGVPSSTSRSAAMFVEGEAAHRLAELLDARANDLVVNCHDTGEPRLDVPLDSALLRLEKILRYCAAVVRGEIDHGADDLDEEERQQQLDEMLHNASRALQDYERQLRNARAGNVVDWQVFGLLERQLLDLRVFLAQALSSPQQPTWSDEALWMGRMWEAATVYHVAISGLIFLDLYHESPGSCQGPASESAVTLAGDLYKQTHDAGLDEDWKWRNLNGSVVATLAHAIDADWQRAVLWLHQELLSYSAYLEAYPAATLPNPVEASHLIHESRATFRSLWHEYAGGTLLASVESMGSENVQIDPLIDSLAFASVPWIYGTLHCTSM